MNEKTFSMNWAGEEIKVTFNSMAWHTNCSCLIQYGETQVLVVASMGSEREGMNFFPLLVDYEEKMYAAGKIKGSRFIKRETRPTDEAVLNARIIDRTIRPLFDQNIRRDIQVVTTVLSLGENHSSEIVGLFGSALALHVSDIPWAGPVLGVRVVKKGKDLILNPGLEDTKEVDFDILVAGNGEKTIMIECEGKEPSEKEILEAVKLAQKNIKPAIKFMNDVRKKIGKEKIDFDAERSPEELEKLANVKKLRDEVKEFIGQESKSLLFKSAVHTKKERKESIKKIENAVVEKFQSEENEEFLSKILRDLKELVEEFVTRQILDNDRRVDGRKLDEVRPLLADPGILARPHGSGLFSRGETQVLSVVTLGTPGEEQLVDGMEGEYKKPYMHHYNFPGYAVGEVKPFRGASRRDIGHGALAEKSLLPVLPNKEDFPYTIRVVSETMTSNGSSSMASVCGSTLSLMDAGVPISKHVAGVAMGMASDGTGNYKILTDIQDLEDGTGGMDFKVAGTVDGITAIQLDTKSDGLTIDQVEETLDRAKSGRMDIIKVLEKSLSSPRKELSPYAPRIEKMMINPEKIRDVIGPGGKMINKIIDETGVQIEIEQDGTVFISSVDSAGMKDAIKWIEKLTEEVEVGKTYNVTVVRIMDFGAFCEILPGQEGLLHVSQISHGHTSNVSDVYKVGDTFEAKVTEIDDMGRINLSVKALLPAPKGGGKDDKSRRPSRGKDRKTNFRK